ncbi:MAG: TolB family protein [Anaerolineaceae bacterium]
MQNQNSRKRYSPLKKLLLCLFCASLVGCNSAKPTPTVLPTQIQNTETQTVTPIPVTETPTPEPSQTLAPIITPTPISLNSEGSSGLIVMAVGDGIYTHLFVIGPDSIPLMRLTDNNYDDEEPAVSPDGTKIAFSSNKNGQWDIYILDLSTKSVFQVTQSKAYDSAPSWSPDGQYLIYQTLTDKNLDLMIQSANDLNSPPIQLTANSGDNFDPAWSPDGRTIAFITNRNGESELWLADLQSVENRFTRLLSAEQTQYRSPRWSPDGTQLALCKQDSESHIEILTINQSGSKPVEIGLGGHPTWSADGIYIMATLDQTNSHYLIAYRVQEKTLFLSPIQTSQTVQSYDWLPQEKSSAIIKYINSANLPAPTPLFSITLSLPLTSSGRKGVVLLEDIEAPEPYLSDSSDEAFIALRQGIGEKSGWDYLATLENAYLPITSTGFPEITQNWLYTGRAIDVNTMPMDAGWMAISREDFNGQTFWRIWIKCLKQDGGCGKPMLSSVWDFTSRFDSDPAAYENGGKQNGIPDGYWIDFTEFSSRYGWGRLPSQADWRYYYPGILFNQLIFSQGADWSESMLELYSADAIKSLGSVK